MHARRSGPLLLIRINRGEEIVEAITQALRDHGIGSGVISAIGATDSATLKFYDLATQVYEERTLDEPCELLSLSGNISMVDGAPWPHLHAVLGRRDFSCIGGHLSRGIVGVTCEVTIVCGDAPLHRAHDAAIGLKLWQL